MSNSPTDSVTSQEQNQPRIPVQPSIAVAPALDETAFGATALNGTALGGASLPAFQGLQQLGLSLDDSVACGLDGC